MMQRNLLAFDLGASNGRAMLARFDGERMRLSELHRFENPVREENGAHRWDANFLLRQLKLGFSACPFYKWFSFNHFITSISFILSWNYVYNQS